MGATKDLMEKQLRFAGVFSISPRPWRIIASVLAGIHFFCCCLQVLSLIHVKDVQSAMDCFSVLSFCSLGFVKYVALFKNRHNIHSLIKNIAQLENISFSPPRNEYEYETDEENDIAKFRKSYLKGMKTLYQFLPKIYISTLFIFILSPFAEYLIFGPDDSDRYPHVLPTWYPKNESISGYLLIILLEILSSTYCVLVHICYDLSSLNYMKFVSGQYKVLRHSLKRISGKGKDWRQTEKRDARAFSRIVHCHEHHKAIARIAESMSEYLLDPVMGIYVTIATLSLCAITIQLSTVSGLQLLSAVQYMTSTLLQLYLYCAHADTVLQESDMRLCRGAFGSAWWSLSPSCRRQLHLLGAITAKPRVLRAGLFHQLNLPSFMATVNTAYSYYAVLSKSR